MKFVNNKLNELYELRPGQGDCEVIIGKLNWRSKLSRITPRIAELMLANGTNLFTRKPIPDEHIRQSEPADKAVGNANKKQAGKRNSRKGHKPPEQ